MTKTHPTPKYAIGNSFWGVSVTFSLGGFCQREKDDKRGKSERSIRSDAGIRPELAKGE
jgi:hypothetical protein